MAGLGAFSCCSPALMPMHMVEKVQAPGEIPAAKARAGDAFQKESRAFPVAAESFSASKSLWGATPKLEAEKESGFGSHEAVSHASGEGSSRVWLQGSHQGASAPPLHRSRHSHCQTRRDRSKHTASCRAAKGNNSQIKPCRLLSAPAAYAKNFRLQIKVV